MMTEPHEWYVNIFDGMTGRHAPIWHNFADFIRGGKYLALDEFIVKRDLHLTEYGALMSRMTLPCGSHCIKFNNEEGYLLFLLKFS